MGETTPDSQQEDSQLQTLNFQFPITYLDRMKKALFLFGELNDDDLDWIIATGQVEKFPKNRILLEEGKPSDNLYILLRGQVEVTKLNGDHQEVISYLGSGEVLGEVSFIDGRLPSATVKAYENSLVLCIPRFQLNARLNQDVGFSSRFYRAIAMFLSSRLRNNIKKIDAEQAKAMQSALDLDDLPPSFIDILPFAEARFDWLLRRVKNVIT